MIILVIFLKYVTLGTKTDQAFFFLDNRQAQDIPPV